MKNEPQIWLLRRAHSDGGFWLKLGVPASTFEWERRDEQKKSEQRKVIYDPQMNSNANRKQIRVDVGIGRACTVRDHEVPMALTWWLVDFVVWKGYTMLLYTMVRFFVLFSSNRTSPQALASILLQHSNGWKTRIFTMLWMERGNTQTQGKKFKQRGYGFFTLLRFDGLFSYRLFVVCFTFS